MKQDTDHAYTLLLTVYNRPGVLVRCAQVLGRRGHTIETFQMRAIEGSTDTSHMAIGAFGKPGVHKQIQTQLSKLIDVVDITEGEG